MLEAHWTIEYFRRKGRPDPSGPKYVTVFTVSNSNMTKVETNLVEDDSERSVSASGEKTSPTDAGTLRVVTYPQR